MTKYKIAFILPNLENQGGINIFVNTLSSHLSNLGHDIHLFPIGKTDYQDNETLHTINSNKKKEQTQIFEEKFHQSIKDKDFDLIISNTLRANFILYTLDIKNALMVFHASGVLKKKHFYTMLKRKYHFRKWYKNQKLIALSKCFKRNFTDKYPNIDYKSFDVIYNGFNQTEIIEKSKEIFEKPDYRYIVCVGRFSRDKDYQSAIRAFAEVHKVQNDLHLVFLGNGAEKENLKTLSKKLNLEPFIHFIGHVPNVFPWIKNADLLLHTSKRETFGNILVEALFVDTPVVATDIQCGPSEILVDELSDFLVPLDNTPLMVEKILLALKSYPPIETKYTEKFLIENIAKQYLSYIKTK